MSLRNSVYNTISWLGLGEYGAGYEDDDILIGGNGVDYLDGGTGNDILVDGFGADNLSGRDGDDHLGAISDGNNDYLYGNGGADSFYFYAEGIGIGADKVKDFSSSDGDHLILGGEDVMFEIIQLAINRSQVTLETSTGEDLGSITVYGEFSADDVTVDNSVFAGVSSTGLVDLV